MKRVEGVANLRSALETCAKTFRRYGELHRAKGTTEGNLKASNNDGLAEFCESVLADTASLEADEPTAAMIEAGVEAMRWEDPLPMSMTKRDWLFFLMVCVTMALVIVTHQ